jgi:hypothetical protein
MTTKVKNAVNSVNARNLSANVGDISFFFGVPFRYDGYCWTLDRILNNPICKKNSGSNRLYSDRAQSIVKC